MNDDAASDGAIRAGGTRLSSAGNLQFTNFGLRLSEIKAKYGRDYPARGTELQEFSARSSHAEPCAFPNGFEKRSSYEGKLGSVIRNGLSLSSKLVKGKLRGCHLVHRRSGHTPLGYYC